MAGNTAPICSRRGNVDWAIGMVAANTTTDLTSGTIYLIWTADATNGGRLERIVVRQLGTNVATVLRIWLNNGSSTGTAANNTLLLEVLIPATTVSQVDAQIAIEIAMDLVLDAGFRVYGTLGTAVAAGLDSTGVGGDY